MHIYMYTYIDRRQKLLGAGIRPICTGSDEFNIINVVGLEIRPNRLLMGQNGEIWQDGHLLAVVVEGEAGLTNVGMAVRNAQIIGERRANERANKLMVDGWNI